MSAMQQTSHPTVSIDELMRCATTARDVTARLDMQTTQERARIFVACLLGHLGKAGNELANTIGITESEDKQ